MKVENQIRMVLWKERNSQLSRSRVWWMRRLPKYQETHWLIRSMWITPKRFGSNSYNSLPVNISAVFSPQIRSHPVQLLGLLPVSIPLSNDQYPKSRPNNHKIAALLISTWMNKTTHGAVNNEMNQYGNGQKVKTYESVVNCQIVAKDELDRGSGLW
jgi:hypothetical protein